MGFRLDQFIGLNSWAQVFVKGHQILAYKEKATRVYPSGIEENVPERDVFITDVAVEVSSRRWKGMDRDYPLKVFKFENGDTFSEYVQFEIWSCGPLVFTALRDKYDEIVAESLWSQVETRNYL